MSCFPKVEHEARKIYLVVEVKEGKCTSVTPCARKLNINV